MSEHVEDALADFRKWVRTKKPRRSDRFPPDWLRVMERCPRRDWWSTFGTPDKVGREVLAWLESIEAPPAALVLWLREALEK